VLAFTFNGIGVPAAATGFVHPIWAMAAMVASVTAVLLNSFAGRLLRRARGAETDDPAELVDQQHRTEHDHGGLATPDETDQEAHTHEDEDEHEAPPAERATRAQQAGGQGARTVAIRVPMHCGNCSSRIESRLAALPGVVRVAADHEADLVTVDHTQEVFEGQLRAKLHGMGFDVEGPPDDPGART
jgi:copper chaperone CopZ